MSSLESPAIVGVTWPIVKFFSLGVCNNATSKQKDDNLYRHLNHNFKCIKAFETHNKLVGRQEKLLLLTLILQMKKPRL